MPPSQEQIDAQLARVREAVMALELHAEQTILSGESDPTLQGARLAILADGGGHIWQAAEPHASDEELIDVVDGVITHLEGLRDRLRKGQATIALAMH
jgi:hypothetical protein